MNEIRHKILWVIDQRDKAGRPVSKLLSTQCGAAVVRKRGQLNGVRRWIAVNCEACHEAAGRSHSEEFTG